MRLRSMASVQVAFWVVALLVVLAVAFDFMNGFHDAANSIATVVSTGVLKPQQAVAFAAFFNFVAIFVFHLKVAATVGKGIVEPGVVDHYVVFGALVGAIAWNVITWWYGIPSSSSHALIGGIVGAVIAKAGAGALIGAGHLEDGGLHLRLARARLPARLAADGRGGVDRVGGARRCTSTTGSGACSSSRPGCIQLGHGGNDAQKTIGIIWMLLIAAGYASASRHDAAALGDLELLRRHRARHACSAAGASSRPWASASPSSSRSAASAPRPAARSRCSSPPGWASRCRPRTPSPAPSSASARRARASAVRWGVAGNIVWAWIFTIPASALIAALAYWLGRALF